MRQVLSRLAPRATSKVNLAWDVVALQVALGFSAFLDAEFTPTWAAAGVALFITVLWTFGGFVLRFYDPWARRLAIDDTAMLSLLVLGVCLTLLMVEAIGVWPWMPPVPLFAFMLWPLIVGPRLLVFRRLARRELPLDEVLVVGTGALGRCTGEDLETRWQPRRKATAYLRLSEDPLCAEIRGAPILGDISDLEAVLQKKPVSEVYFAVSPVKHGAELQKAINVCERLGMPFAVPAFPFRMARARPKNAATLDDGYLHFVHTRSDQYSAALKRLFDIVASATALVVLLPLFAVVALAIKLTSRGPVFFKQLRVGLHGRPFHMFKFRSMVVNADAMKDQLKQQNEQRGPVFKMKNDPRVTRVGRFIRKFSIDELPQLLNVLRGEMSIVGPRPPVPKEVAQYEGWQRRRLSVRPGLTCIWQVSGRNEISFEDWMYLDMQYIDHWSLARDVSLVLKTVPVVLTGKGAS